MPAQSGGPYYYGEAPWFKVAFTDPDTGAPVDPTVVTFQLKDPSGAVTPYTLAGGQITRVDVGQYKLKVQLNLAGAWHVAWSCSPNYTGATEYDIYVRPSNFH